MSREIKKPNQIRESDLKDYAGDVMIDVSERKEEEESKVKVSVPEVAAAEVVAVQAAQAVSDSDVKTLSFNAWFQKVSAKNPRIKLSYKEAIQAHCLAVGLELKSTEEAYDAALKHFGL